MIESSKLPWNHFPLTNSRRHSEKSSTWNVIRTDKLGNKVEIPPGYSYMEGPDNVGVAIAPCAKATVDNVGRMHSVPKGYILKIGKNGKGVIVAPGEPTRETKQGQLELLKKIMKP